MNRVRRVSWIPPFVVGLSAAIAAEVAVGLLLYVTPGFLRALTLILAVMLSSLALGLWTAPHSDEGLTERLRRRWLLVLFAFAGGSVVAGFWSVRGGLSGSASTQGLGLALLAALPLYSCGALLGGMSAPKLSQVRGPVGSAAAAGGALGTVLAGYVLAAVLHPVSIYAFCLVLLSGAAIVHGAVIAAEGERKRLFTAPSAYGPVRVDEWSWGKTRRERVLTENGRVRGLEDVSGKPVRKWENAAVEILTGVAAAHRAAAPDQTPPAEVLRSFEGTAEPSPEPVRSFEGTAEPSPEPLRSFEESPAYAATPAPESAAPSVLILGGGALTLPRLILGRGGLDVEVVERNPALLEAARAHFSAPAEGARLRVRVEDPRTAAKLRAERHVAIVVDSGALAPEDPIVVVDARELEALRSCLGGDGLLLIGGVDRDRAHGPPLDHLLSQAQLAFPSIAVFVATRAKRAPLVSHAPAAEMMLVLSPRPNAAFPKTAGDLTLESVSRRPEPAPPTAHAGDLS